MINQQLLDYIKQQLQQKIPRETVTNSLLAQGWQKSDIEEAFNSINHSASNQRVSNFSSKVPIQMWKIITASLLGVVIIYGGIYFISQRFFKSEETLKTSNEISDQSPTNQLPASKSIETVIPPEQSTEQNRELNLQINFANKLSSCTKYKITFKHPLTGDLLEKEILGIIDGKCNYVEQMPNGGKLECKYSENERVIVAQYYKDVYTAESTATETSISVSIDFASGKTNTEYTINGKVMDNPIQEAMNNGVCIISGY